MTYLVLVAGSMAAGKSTVSQIVVDRLRARGLDVAFTALDDVADMARPTLPDWQWAHEIHARLVGLWVQTGIDVVVDEGASSLEEVETIHAQLPAGTAILHVVLTAEYGNALKRALKDPSRGISKEPAFLRAQYDHFATQLPLLPCDLLLHVDEREPSDLAADVVAAFDLDYDIGARGERENGTPTSGCQPKPPQ